MQEARGLAGQEKLNLIDGEVSVKNQKVTGHVNFDK
jgi:hypothetical protein